MPQLKITYVDLFQQNYRYCVIYNPILLELRRDAILTNNKCNPKLTIYKINKRKS